MACPSRAPLAAPASACRTISTVASTESGTSRAPPLVGQRYEIVEAIDTNEQIEVLYFHPTLAGRVARGAGLAVRPA